MKIDTTTIQGYAEMSAEDKIKALEALEFDDFSADRDRYKESNSKALAKVAELTKQLRERMSDEEKAKAEKETADKEMTDKIAELTRRLAVSDNEKKLLGMGYDSSLATEVAEAMADGDTEKVFTGMAKFKELHEKAVRAEIAKGAPKIDGKGKDGKDTDDEDVAFAKKLGKNKAESAKASASALGKFIK